MSYPAMLADANGVPIPQYWNLSALQWEPITGANGILDSDRTTASALASTQLVFVTTSGTSVQLPTIACRTLIITGLHSNTGRIYVGGSNVTNEAVGLANAIYGIAMGADGTITLDITNANLLYIDADNSGEGVSIIALP